MRRNNVKVCFASITLALLTPALLVTSCGWTEEPATSKVIYGEDDRRDLNSSDNNHLMIELADSTVALVSRGSLSRLDNSSFKLPSGTFGESRNFCANEPFRNQPNPAFCSGFLIATDTMGTAGHCITSQSSCDDVAFVFGFAYKQADNDPTIVPVNEVYYCREVVHTQALGGGADFAVVKLDRAVVGHAPLTFRTEGNPGVGAGLTVIGHPSGLPTKITGGATVRSVSQTGYLVADTDTYGGNSGSAVFNSSTGLLEGILVRGETDFVYNNGCYASNVCSQNGCRGEDITLASNLSPYVETTPDPDPETIIRAYELTNIGLSIPDSNAQGVAQAINVAQSGNIVIVGITLKVNHTYIGDLRVRLIHPDGSEVLLHNRSGGSANDLNMDMAVDSLQGKPATGTWQLVIADHAFYDTGTLDYLKLTIETNSSEIPTDPVELTQDHVYDQINLAIPDYNTTGITQIMPVTQQGRVLAMEATIRITHTYIGDLTVTLTSPNGTTATLHNRSGGSQDDIYKTFPIDDFEEEDASGNWLVKVVDHARIDTGTLDYVKLTVTTVY